jgi:hypothetical protein
MLKERRFTTENTESTESYKKITEWFIYDVFSEIFEGSVVNLWFLQDLHEFFYSSNSRYSLHLLIFELNPFVVRHLCRFFSSFCYAYLW